MALIIHEPWWKTDDYVVDELYPESLLSLAGPQGLAYVQVFADGKTSKGWGLGEHPSGKSPFMFNYESTRMSGKMAARRFKQKGMPHALVTRSAKVICVDIDGKNGGFEHAHEVIGNSQPTLAETSKSGTGYHLFYEVEQDWDSDTGYGSLPDRVGIATGVDIRAVGCVYRFPSQRWNERSIVPAPKHLVDSLTKHATRVKESTRQILSTVQNSEDWEILLMGQDLLAELAEPIKPGNRNKTLFAIGSKLMLATVPDWEQAIQDRANEIGLDASEAYKIVQNVKSYVPQP